MSEVHQFNKPTNAFGRAYCLFKSQEEVDAIWDTAAMVQAREAFTRGDPEDYWNCVKALSDPERALLAVSMLEYITRCGGKLDYFNRVSFWQPTPGGPTVQRLLAESVNRVRK